MKNQTLNKKVCMVPKFQGTIINLILCFAFRTALGAVILLNDAFFNEYFLEKLLNLYFIIILMKI